MQAILFDDNRYEKFKNSPTFINYYIFPGGELPCLSVLNKTANQTKLILSSYFDNTSSYTKTLAEWQQRFNQKSDELTSHGFDDYFKRLWNFYFSICQALFSMRQIFNAHIVFCKIS